MTADDTEDAVQGASRAARVQVPMPIGDDELGEVADRLLEHVKNSSTDLAPNILELDPDGYRDDELADRERRMLFGRVPTVVAHSSELPRPGSFLALELPNNDALVIRQRDRSVRAFVNSCRHRGAQLLADESGSRQVLSCGYHGWAYGIDGSLRSVADSDTFGDVGGRCLDLVELPAEERHGLIWVLDSAEGSIELDTWLGEMAGQALALHDLQNFTCYRKDAFQEPINWKALTDAFLDNYHIKAVHSGSVAPYFYNNIVQFTRFGHHSRTVAPKKSIDNASLVDDPSELGNHVAIGHFVMPNVLLIRQPDHVEMLTFTPGRIGAASCRMEIRLLVPNEALTESHAALWERNWDILMAVLRDEDLVLNRALQRAVESRSNRMLLFGRNEIANQYFHDEIARIVGAEDEELSS